MRKETLLVFLLVISCSQHLYAGDDSTHSPSMASEVKILRSQLTAIKNKYATTLIVPGSDDYQRIMRLADSPDTATSVFDELIELLAVREPAPQTFEKFSLVRVSPAAKVLVRLGKAIEPRIKERLSSQRLTIWQRNLLGEVIRLIDQEPYQGGPFVRSNGLMETERPPQMESLNPGPSPSSSVFINSTSSPAGKNSSAQVTPKPKAFLGVGKQYNTIFWPLILGIFAMVGTWFLFLKRHRLSCEDKVNRSDRGEGIRKKEKN